ncbi:transcriptional regulator with XRE-family HTH domain [Melghirimyces profundicolus]|uniref:Transcriptional regulator with XRE-family HTH domain n=1 Tax=Melghirimyces profundicolus TaxID=1242148 RepID=A0A2T6BXH4_9BACL|nr:tetratricopeptide repeat protein [Melghirimyces profundicolus]PTX60765.1 transcriptional regulator with XRE-family HTH domain [Melghirimyces profundicolus]
MAQMETCEIGEVIRKIRKEKGLRLEDLSDEHISPATISNLERGIPHVKKEKLLYLLEKLDLSLNQLPELLMDEKQNLAHVRFQLEAIESMQRFNQLDPALDSLNALGLDDGHPYAPTMYWLRGVCYMFQNKIERAERELFSAIRLSSQSSQAKWDNIESYSFNDLGLCAYKQNDLQKALKFTGSGLASFVPEGNRKVVKYILLRNKAIYLERLGRTVDALNTVQDVWNDLAHIEQSETLFTFYWLRGELLRKSGAIDEAIQYARKGIELASLNSYYKSAFDLWSLLGSLYTEKSAWDEAETCFNLAMSMPKEMVYTNQYINTCTKLGNLYLYKGDWEKAEEYLNLAIREGEDYTSPTYLTDAVLIKGHFYYKQKRIRKAIASYQRAVELSKKFHFPDKEYQAWYHLARCWKDMDGKEFMHSTENMFIAQEKLTQKERRGDHFEMV